MSKPFKQPVSVLVVIYTTAGNVLLLERADRPGFWQSVTGSRENDEPLAATASREVFEETGLTSRIDDWGYSNRYEIYQHWRHRYAPGTYYNTEHVFGLKLATEYPVTLAANEHLRFVWLDWAEAAEKVFSPSNAEAIRLLPQHGLIS